MRADQLLAQIHLALQKGTFVRTASDRYESTELPLAVEVGHLYGEVTVKWFLTRGPVQTEEQKRGNRNVRELRTERLNMASTEPLMAKAMDAHQEVVREVRDELYSF